MGNNKKSKGSKKKSSAGTRAAQTTASPSVVEQVERIEARCTVAYAQELEAKFRQGYPPMIDYEDYLDSLSNKQAKKVDAAYSKVSAHFNSGITLTSSPTGKPGISRWHLTVDKLLDAIEVVVEQASDAFLTTVNTDHRNLLCKICLTVAQTRGKALDPSGQVAWAKVAVAADPTYFNAYNQLGLGYMNGGHFKEALAASEQANLLSASYQGPETPATTLQGRLGMLRAIVHDKSKSMHKEVILERAPQALRWYQEMGMELPAKRCNFCMWPGSNKCSRCMTVYYCSRDCQRFDYKEHKHSCVEPSAFKKQQEYPAPNFPVSEQCSDQVWSFFEKHKVLMREPTVLIAASNNCHAGAVKRALQNGEDVNTLGDSVREYAVQLAALRREPENAVTIMTVLIAHGACPNVIRGDGKHLLAICRARAQWIDDSEPSMENRLFCLQNKIGGMLDADAPDPLERVEREESQALVDIVTSAIQQHKLCRLCKARKQNKLSADAHLQVPNMTDALLARQELARGSELW